MIEMLADLPSSPDALIEPLAALVDDMRAGNERALESLYEATVGKLYAVASAILRHAQDAEDVVCETYAQAWESAAQYDRSRSSVLCWLMMMCRSRALDCLRRRRMRATTATAVQLESLQAEEGPPEDLLTLIESGGRVHAAMSRLSSERRQLVSLSFLRELSHQEIADLTGMPLGTVKSHLRRALAQLREELEARS